jgi:tetratricopeptide (TPR) repeat protein
MRSLLLLLVASPILPAPHSLGPQTCALCHKEIAQNQEQTAMATTWQGRVSAWLPLSFQASITDSIAYHFKRNLDSMSYSLGETLTLPVAISMGGRRHGLGFLVALDQVDGIPLARRTLVQARYAWSPEKNTLVLAPGSAPRPDSLESTLGEVLSPTFESRCLACHGQPDASGSGKAGGVHCEACHGPGSAHLSGVAAGHPQQGILNPARLSNEDSMQVCAQCHVGLTRFSDPSPDDLLIANQVRAIQSSECFLQSGKAFSCTTCHNPHADATDDNKAITACLGCHSTQAKVRAAICPVNSATGCTNCHMPAIDRGPLHLVDHLIRVHPEQKVESKQGTGQPTTVRPISEYLRLIATNSSASASGAKMRLNQGESFYDVARQLSTDPSAAIGGYLGRKTLSDLATDLAQEAARLKHSEVSGVIESNGRWVILQRLPRDFRYDAEALQNQAESLAASGNPAAAIKKAQEALMIYPQFLRALNFIGLTFTQNGNPKKGGAVLSVSTRLYPEDAIAQFLLAASLNLSGDPSAAKTAYRRAIELDPDFTAAYANLGMLLYDAHNWQSAVQYFRQGLQINPLSAELNYDLSLALTKTGDDSGAAQAKKLARRLDPDLVKQHETIN